MKHCRYKQYFSCWLIFGSHYSITSNFNYLWLILIVSRLDKILIKDILSMFFAFLELFSYCWSKQLYLSTKKNDYNWLFIGAEKKFLCRPYFCIKGEPSNSIEILMFIVWSEEWRQHKEQLSFFYFLMCPVALIFSENIEKRHWQFYWVIRLSKWIKSHNRHSE